MTAFNVGWHQQALGIVVSWEFVDQFAVVSASLTSG